MVNGGDKLNVKVMKSFLRMFLERQNYDSTQDALVKDIQESIVNEYSDSHLLGLFNQFILSSSALPEKHQSHFFEDSINELQSIQHTVNGLKRENHLSNLPKLINAGISNKEQFKTDCFETMNTLIAIIEEDRKNCLEFLSTVANELCSTSSILASNHDHDKKQKTNLNRMKLEVNKLSKTILRIDDVNESKKHIIQSISILLKSFNEQEKLLAQQSTMHASIDNIHKRLHSLHTQSKDSIEAVRIENNAVNEYKLCAKDVFEESVKKAVDSHSNKHNDLYLVEFEVDDFSSYQQQFGIVIAQRIMKMVGTTIWRTVRATDPISSMAPGKLVLFACLPKGTFFDPEYTIREALPLSIRIRGDFISVNMSIKTKLIKS